MTKVHQKRSEFIATQITKDNIDTIGIYRLLAKKDSDNIRDSSTENLIKQLAKYNVNIIIYEPLLSSKEISGAKVVTSIEELKKVSDVIVSNRVSDELSDVLEKVYTRDIFNRD